jgi:hypothetical protein
MTMRARATVLCCAVLLLSLALAGAGLLLGQREMPPLLFAPVTHPEAPASNGPHGPSTPALRMPPGERPPQFVLVSFDGAGWSRMWDYWFSVAERVPFHFTGFLSGTYLLSERTRDAYHPPYYPAGSSQINWYDEADLPVEIANLNRALRTGNEIGTHFNGHFCAGAGLPSGGNTWSEADWDQELSQFFDLLTDYRTNNQLPASVRLRLRPSDIHGSRTPCLEGSPEELYPALRRHRLEYDSSFTHPGLSWPTRSPEGIWQIGMALFPLHGRLPDGRTGVSVTTMDYNFYFTQRGAVPAPTAEDSARDSQQVLETYRDMYAAAYSGNRAPLVLGNHFNDWNNGAYRDALARFVLDTCGRPETQCVTYTELIAWMEAQTPRVLRRLQASTG